MPVRLSCGWRIALKVLFKIQTQTPGVDERLALLTRRHRKPLREWLHQQIRRASVEPDLEPLTAAEYAVLERAEPRERGKVFSSILDTLDAADTAMNSNLEPKDDSPR